MTTIANEIIALRGAGHTTTEIARRVGYSARTVARHLSRAGMTAPATHDLPPFGERLAKAKAMLDEGYPRSVAAAIAHVSPKTLARRWPDLKQDQAEAARLNAQLRAALRRVDSRLNSKHA